jgi:hypothetical protein
MFVSSGWVNVLLWVVTGRQFGFTASSVRPPSDDEADDPGEAALGQSRPKPSTVRSSHEYQRESMLGGFIPPQPAFPPSRTSEPEDISLSTFPPSRHGYDNLVAYGPGVYDPYAQR